MKTVEKKKLGQNRKRMKTHEFLETIDKCFRMTSFSFELIFPTLVNVSSKNEAKNRGSHLLEIRCYHHLLEILQIHRVRYVLDDRVHLGFRRRDLSN